MKTVATVTNVQPLWSIFRDVDILVLFMDSQVPLEVETSVFFFFWNLDSHPLSLEERQLNTNKGNVESEQQRS